MPTYRIKEFENSPFHRRSLEQEIREKGEGWSPTSHGVFNPRSVSRPRSCPSCETNESSHCGGRSPPLQCCERWDCAKVISCPYSPNYHHTLRWKKTENNRRSNIVENWNFCSETFIVASEKECWTCFDPIGSSSSALLNWFSWIVTL